MKGSSPNQGLLDGLRRWVWILQVFQDVKCGYYVERLSKACDVLGPHTWKVSLGYVASLAATANSLTSIPVRLSPFDLDRYSGDRRKSYRGHIYIEDSDRAVLGCISLHNEAVTPITDRIQAEMV